jgi:homoserine kinase
MTLPATIPHLGPGLGGLALAVQLNTTLEFSQRDDDQLVLDVTGVDKNAFDTWHHPALLAAVRVFQRLERAPTGLNIHVMNNIPVKKGLGARTAFAVGGVLGANNLIGASLPRETLMALAAEVAGGGAGVAAAMLGGLASGVLHGDRVIYRALAPAHMRVAIALPKIRRYQNKTARALPKVVDYDDALYNLSRVALLVDAFRQMDFAAIGDLMQDRVLTPRLVDNITGYEDAAAAAKRAGAVAVSLCGTGPAVVAFAPKHHHAIADAMRDAFAAADTEAQTWVLPVDRQGVVMSVTQTA